MTKVTMKVVYDACVIYPASLRDLLMNLATSKAVSTHWSDEIHEEWISSLLENRPDLKREALERTRREMDGAVIGGLVTDYEHLVESLRLPDPNDRHVLAVAIRVGATLIVTLNLNDFQKSDLAAFGVEAVSPDEFIDRLIVDKPITVLDAVRSHRQSLRNPAMSVDEYMDALRRQGLVRTVAFLGEHRGDI